jgi:hypothetical protein
MLSTVRRRTASASISIRKRVRSSMSTYFRKGKRMNSTQVDNHCRLAKRVSRVVRYLPRIGDDEDGTATYGQVAALYAAIVHACAEIVQHCAGACQKIDDIPSRVPESEIEVAIIWREVAERAMHFLGRALIDWNESNVFGNSVRLLPRTDPSGRGW